MKEIYLVSYKELVDLTLSNKIKQGEYFNLFNNNFPIHIDNKPIICLEYIKDK